MFTRPLCGQCRVRTRVCPQPGFPRSVSGGDVDPLTFLGFCPHPTPLVTQTLQKGLVLSRSRVSPEINPTGFPGTAWGWVHPCGTAREALRRQRLARAQ